MKTAESWEQQINLWESGTPELIKLIRAIQKDALLEAAKIAAKASENLTMYYGAVCARDAILARAKEVEDK